MQASLWISFTTIVIASLRLCKAEHIALKITEFETIVVFKYDVLHLRLLLVLFMDSNRDHVVRLWIKSHEILCNQYGSG